MVTVMKYDATELALVEQSKSNHSLCGKELREVHYQLGELAASKLIDMLHSSNVSDITLVILMRSGLMMGLGFADELERHHFKVHIQFKYDDTPLDEATINHFIILVDAVINTGNSLMKIINNLSSSRFAILTVVINQEAITRLDRYSVYAMRSSENSYKGSFNHTIENGYGPDTGERLFSSDFYTNKSK